MERKKGKIVEIINFSLDSFGIKKTKVYEIVLIKNLIVPSLILRFPTTSRSKTTLFHRRGKAVNAAITVYKFDIKV